MIPLTDVFTIMDNNNNQFPSKPQQIKNLAGTLGNVAWGAARGHGVFAPEHVKKSRMDICKSCQYFSRSDTRCKHCGCYLESKTSLKASKCPINKWTFYTQD